MNRARRAAIASALFALALAVSSAGAAPSPRMAGEWLQDAQRAREAGWLDEALAAVDEARWAGASPERLAEAAKLYRELGCPDAARAASRGKAGVIGAALGV